MAMKWLLLIFFSHDWLLWTYLCMPVVIAHSGVVEGRDEEVRGLKGQSGVGFLEKGQLSPSPPAMESEEAVKSIFVGF